MPLLSVVNKTRGSVLGERVRHATSLHSRIVGLLGTSSLPPGEGLWIAPCRQIHMFFMRYAIDVIFLDARQRVIDQRTIAPWRVSAWIAKSRGALELPAGTIAKSKTQLGDEIEMSAR